MKLPYYQKVADELLIIAVIFPCTLTIVGCAFCHYDSIEKNRVKQQNKTFLGNGIIDLSFW